MDERAVEQSLALDPDMARAARAAWREMMEAAVWGELRAPSPSALTHLRKRVFATGERLRSMFSGRAWIPHPRERLKNALASLIQLRQGLAELEGAIDQLEGGADLRALRARFGELRAIAARLDPAAAQWAAFLEAQYRDDGD